MVSTVRERDFSRNFEEEEGTGLVRLSCEGGGVEGGTVEESSAEDCRRF
jgi:hypothetical protein